MVEIFDHWRKRPPVHRILAAVHQIKPQLTSEEQVAQGAMGPKDFLAWVKHTKGQKLGPSSG